MTRPITNRRNQKLRTPKPLFSLLALAALLVAPFLLGCEDVLGPQTKCYYDDTGLLFVHIQCTTEEKTAPWELCGNTETIANCEDWLRRQGIAA